ncbi:RNA polymerase sigma factor [Paenibacillus macerans]|uniref:RNA polymerase sigma factor n=1 Tax=Paenibacillus macerans TaxID=44252 RepID=UPI00203B7763|nr:sigma-70 family RNA polymerase sigma factor [Paenibacillus macerans]MCM3700655.1 sigma-70 family RNA polymerase sigma factor [Paenibacillus macerans]
MDIQDIYQSYKGEIFGYLLKILNNKQDAEDLLQECFVRYIRSSPDIPENRICPYIKKIARNLAIDMFKKRKYMSRCVWSAEELYCQDSPDFESREEVIRILRLVRNAEHRIILHLRLIQGYSIKETARIINKSESLVKSSQFKALKQIRSRYIS